MGINIEWIQDFKKSLEEIGIVGEILSEGTIKIGNQTVICCIGLKDRVKKDFLSDQRYILNQNGLKMCVLWEDVWHTRKLQVLSRLLYFAGKSKRIHGRKCKVIDLKKRDFKNFLQNNHLQGDVPCKYIYGLAYQDNLIAVAGFNQLIMNSKGDGYRSSELIRYCTVSGINISGGLSKLIKAHKNAQGFDDLMTYADKDWSVGTGYHLLGFDLEEETKEIDFYVELDTNKRISMSQYTRVLSKNGSETSQKYIQVFNSGNIKFRYRNVSGK